MSRCSEWNARIKLIRGADPDVRYVAICDDCGIRTAPTSMATARLVLNTHRRFAEAHAADREAEAACMCAECTPALAEAEVVRLDSRRGCVCAECAPALAAAREAAFAAEAAQAAVAEGTRRKRKRPRS